MRDLDVGPIVAGGSSHTDAVTWQAPDTNTLVKAAIR